MKVVAARDTAACRALVKSRVAVCCHISLMLLPPIAVSTVNDTWNVQLLVKRVMCSTLAMDSCWALDSQERISGWYALRMDCGRSQKLTANWSVTLQSQLSMQCCWSPNACKGIMMWALSAPMSVNLGIMSLAPQKRSARMSIWEGEYFCCLLACFYVTAYPLSKHLAPSQICPVFELDPQWDTVETSADTSLRFSPTELLLFAILAFLSSLSLKHKSV
ncbi:hypothetical protein JRQ81_014029 [Phrynocephalus forsythii]|uniref:Uncharacterized protein n=1 Tax=Phrynocephalus forsythii TaxID=171643 RepID=A0A9Q0XVY2_9SAUR|nr:hypothetical protein JRQ81_014029 [Phrynocephalus forsythii]